MVYNGRERRLFMQKPFIGDFPITQKFGEDPEYYKKFNLAGHEGIDFGCPVGTPILAAEKGIIVRRSLSTKDYGEFIVVWHKELNLATWYCHLSEQLINVGDTVEKGQRIGTSGNTGNTSGPHLHFNVCKTDANGYRIGTNNGYQGFIDPAPYLDMTPQEPNDALKACLNLHSQLVDQIEKELKPQISDLTTRLNDANAMLKEDEHNAEDLNTQITSLKQFQQDTATALVVENKPEVIKGQIAKLVSEETQLLQVLKEKTQLQAEVEAATEAAAKSEQQYKDAVKVNGEISQQMGDLRSEKDTLIRQLEVAQTAATLKIVGKLFGYYIAVHK